MSDWASDKFSIILYSPVFGPITPDISESAPSWASTSRTSCGPSSPVNCWADVMLPVFELMLKYVQSTHSGTKVNVTWRIKTKSMN